MADRRAAGGGSVYRRKDSRRVTVVTVAGRRLSRHATTRREADNRPRGLLNAHDRRTLVPSQTPTRGDGVGTWRDGVGDRPRPSIPRTYRLALEPIVEVAGHGPRQCRRTARALPARTSKAYGTPISRIPQHRPETACCAEFVIVPMTRATTM